VSEESALKRLQRNVKILHALVIGLEDVLRTGADLDDERVRQAMPFLRLTWALATGMLDVLRAKRADGHTVWNVPALTVLARSLQEAHINFYYFAAEPVAGEETEFRRLLWARHQAFKRMDLLARSDQSTSAISKELPGAKQEFEAAHGKLLAHPALDRLPKNTADALRNNRERFIAEPMQDVWARAGMPIDMYEPSFRLLSQGTHATPYGLMQLEHHQAGTEEGAVNMNVPIGLAVACCASTLGHTGNLHERLDALMPKALREFLAG
jgi:hypothetical protein